MKLSIHLSRPRCVPMRSILFELTSFMLILFVLIFLIPQPCSRADDLDNVLFEGVVRDATGAVLPGAVVRLILEATQSERSVQTDDEGRYRITAFEPGRYA